jgi:DnaK suppressor protein
METRIFRIALEQILKTESNSRIPEILSEPTPPNDASDIATSIAAKELAAQHLDLSYEKLMGVRMALDRINTGTFGVCEACEGEISTKRLKAVPWTPLCIHCAEKAEKVQGKEGVPHHQLGFHNAIA